MTEYEIKRLENRIRELWNEKEDLLKEKEELENQNRLLGERCNQLLKDKGELTDNIADIKANCDLAIEGRDIKIKELELELTVEKDQHQEEINLRLHAEDYIKSLEKENAEIKEQGDKWFVFETEAGNWGMDKATQYTVDRHNYFYGTKEECQKWGVEHKIKDYTGHKYCYDRLDNQLIKAKDLIELFVQWNYGCCKIPDLKDIVKQAEQFIKEIEK